MENKDKKDVAGKVLSFEVDLTKKTEVEFGQLFDKVKAKKPKSFAEAIELMAEISRK